MQDRDELRARYPAIFNRPTSARLATPAMLLLAFGIFVFGLVDLEFSPTRLVNFFREIDSLLRYAAVKQCRPF